MSQDPFVQLKQRQREMWATFGPTALFTTPVAAQVVRFAGIVAATVPASAAPAHTTELGLPEPG